MVSLFLEVCVELPAGDGDSTIQKCDHVIESWRLFHDLARLCAELQAGRMYVCL